MIFVTGTVNANPSMQVVSELAILPVLESHLIYVLFSQFLVGAIYVDKQTVGFKFKHVDKIIITYKNKGSGFKSDDLCEQGYTYTFFEE